MKIFLLLLLFLFCSCAQTKYLKDKNQNFNKVEAGTTYVVFGNENFKKRLMITSLDENFINGVDKNGRNFTLKKSEVQKIRKNNTGGTIALSVLGASSGLALTGMLLFVKGLGDN